MGTCIRSKLIVDDPIYMMAAITLNDNGRTYNCSKIMTRTYNTVYDVDWESHHRLGIFCKGHIEPEESIAVPSVQGYFTEEEFWISYIPF